jgi:predicted NAD/FAD-dependent oxidoreductase
MTAGEFDVVVIGAGPAGEVCSGRLGEAGLSVAVSGTEGGCPCNEEVPGSSACGRRGRRRRRFRKAIWETRRSASRRGT